MLLASLGLAGCETIQAPDNGEPAGSDRQQAAAEPPIEIVPDLTPRQRWLRALELLETGVEAPAVAELKAALEAQPRYGNAKMLLEQIETPIYDYFPRESFPVTLESGQSLSTLAQEYLGNVMLFYALARYNKIEVPQRVKTGRVLAMPATSLALARRDQPPTPQADPVVPPDPQFDDPIVDDTVDESKKSVAAGPLQELNALIAAGDVLEAVDVFRAMRTPAEGELAVAGAYALEQYGKIIASDNPEEAARAFFEAAQLEDDLGRLERVFELSSAAVVHDPGHTQAQDLLSAAQVALVPKLYATASAAAKAGRQEEALSVANRVLAYDPGHIEAGAMKRTIEADLIEDYYRDCTVAFQQQKLDETIELCGKIIQIDPQHADAMIYRNKAEDLKKRLESLNRS